MSKLILSIWDSPPPMPSNPDGVLVKDFLELKRFICI